MFVLVVGTADDGTAAVVVVVIMVVFVVVGSAHCHAVNPYWVMGDPSEAYI